MGTDRVLLRSPGWPQTLTLLPSTSGITRLAAILSGLVYYSKSIEQNVLKNATNIKNIP